MGLTFLYDPWGLQRKRGMSDAHGFDKKVSNPWVLEPGEPVAPLGPGSQSVKFITFEMRKIITDENSNTSNMRFLWEFIVKSVSL